MLLAIVLDVLKSCPDLFSILRVAVLLEGGEASSCSVLFLASHNSLSSRFTTRHEPRERGGEVALNDRPDDCDEEYPVAARTCLPSCDKFDGAMFDSLLLGDWCDDRGQHITDSVLQ